MPAHKGSELSRLYRAMGLNVDFSDIYEAIDGFKDEAKEKMREVGEDAVAYAIENGNYKDVTGRLRASNKYAVDDNGLKIYNDAPYASSVEARGKEVISGAALFAEKRLKEIFE